MRQTGLAIEVSGLHKSYRSLIGAAQVALRGVDLRVPRGTAFGLIGQNGAGKTSFLKTLLGVVRPSAGSVRVLGGDPEEPAVRRRIGYLPERLHLPAALDGIGFLTSVARLKGVRVAAQELRDAAHRVGLSNDATRLIGTYSKGMKQRLALAAALLGAPDLLVLDEPTDGVDPLGRADIRVILAEERARGATIFFTGAASPLDRSQPTAARHTIPTRRDAPRMPAMATTAPRLSFGLRRWMRASRKRARRDLRERRVLARCLP